MDSIDERLQRLTERHEALRQSIELMVAENRRRDRRFEQLNLRELAARHAIVRAMQSYFEALDETGGDGKPEDDENS